MFSILLTVVIAIGVHPSASAPLGPSVEPLAHAGVTVIVEAADSNHVDCNCAERGYGVKSGLSCDCICSSANYPWNWLGSLKQICHPPQLSQCGLPPGGKKSCPAYYGFYDRPYNFRRTFDYQWRSPPYRPRNIAPRGANSARRSIGQTKQGDGYDELAPTSEVLGFVGKGRAKLPLSRE